LILVDPLPLGSSVKFVKRKCNGELQEGDKIFRVEFLGFVACVLSWRLCRSRKGVLNWAYARSNEINFNNKIKGNRMLEVEIEEEHRSSKLYSQRHKRKICIGLHGKQFIVTKKRAYCK
jgi:hypothetical protein